MGPAKKFIDMLEAQGLLEDDLIAELRRQVAESRTRMTPEIIAKLLVDNEQLTKFQATKLIAKLKESSPPSPAAPSNTPASGAGDDEGLGLAPEPSTEEGSTPASDGASAALIFDDDEVDDEVELTEVSAVEVVPIEVEEVIEVEAVEAEPVETYVQPKRPSKPEKSKPSSKKEKKPAVAPNKKMEASGPKKNPWDSFRVWGMMIVLLLLMIPFVILGIWLWKGNADELLVKAKDAYEGQDYDTAIEKYTLFNKNFPAHESAGLARVRTAISRIRKETKTGSDPTRALATAKEVLPALTNEKALSGERNDLAGAMLMLAEKFNTKADQETDVANKKKLIAGLDEHLELCKNPQFIGSAERNQNDDRIKRIEEDRSRILRDIQRTDDLAAAMTGMRDALDAKDVTKAYGIRRELVRKHVQLESESGLLELIKEATGIQKGLVASSKAAPTLEDAAASSKKGVLAILANRRESNKEKPPEGTIIVRAKRSIYGLNSSNGAVRWRHTLGADLRTDPKRLGQDGDAIVSAIQNGVVKRLQAETGEVVWSVAFGRPINEPTIDRDEIFITARDGGVYCLDGNSGQMRWGKQLPQGIETGVGMGAGKSTLYVAGDHSNLYALSRRDGSCSEVFYLGHQAGTLRVPPLVTSSGHLLVFENAAPNACTVRVNITGNDGLGIKASQLPITLKGHTVVMPEADGRKVAVATDLGEVAILEIETSRTKDQVARLTGHQTKEDQPKIVWPLLSNNDLWLVGSNLSKLKVNVSKQTLDAPVVFHDQDAFIGRPQKLGNHIVHTRIVRGTMGIRVVAAEMETGASAWEVDLGVPISWVKPSEKIFPVEAISTQAALYNVEQDHFLGKIACEVAENAGRNERSLLFRNPFNLGENGVVFVNQQSPIQWAFYKGSEPKGSRLKRVALGMNGAALGAEPIAIGTNNVFAPADNGQLHVLDAMTGQRKASPYVSTLEPGQTLSWIGPTLASDKRTVVVADSARRLFRIGLGNQLSVLTEKTFDKTLKGRLLSLGTNILGIAKGSGDSIELFSEADLTPTGSVPLQGNIVWGPFLVGNTAMVYSEADGLVSIAENGSKQWQSAIPGMIPVGEPILFEGDLVLASAQGVLYRLELNGGKVVGTLKVGESVSGTPAVASGLILVPCDEGVVVALKGNEFTANAAAEVAP